MEIIIQTIPHKNQRYKTVGDWFRDKNGVLHIKVSDMGNDKYTLLVALHELIEASLCEDRGITDVKVTAFDKKFESERAAGMQDDDSEAGDDVRAPYRKEHFFATNIERLLSAELRVDWKKYDKAVMSL